MLRNTAFLLVFAVGILVGLAVFSFLESFGTAAPEGIVDDPREIGLSWAWLAFGFGAQVIFMGRMVVQWIATERAKESVVPAAFWWLSMVGSMMLLTYFLRRGDPVGVLGQSFGAVVYLRNLFFIYRPKKDRPKKE